LVHHNLLHDVGIIHVCVGKIRCFDPFPIFIELGKILGNLASPFKFNSCWEEVEYFQNLVIDNRDHFQDGTTNLPCSQFFVALHKFKLKSSTWERERDKLVYRDIQGIDYYLEATCGMIHHS